MLRWEATETWNTVKLFLSAAFFIAFQSRLYLCFVCLGGHFFVILLLLSIEKRPTAFKVSYALSASVTKYYIWGFHFSYCFHICDIFKKDFSYIICILFGVFSFLCKADWAFLTKRCYPGIQISLFFMINF